MPSHEHVRRHPLTGMIIRSRAVSLADSVAFTTGRILMSLLFLVSAWLKYSGWQEGVRLLAGAGLVPAPLLLGLALGAEALGGLGLLLGYQVRLASLGLFLYLIPVTVLFHDFWNAPAAQATEQQLQFLKNVALMGGLLALWSGGGHGAGPSRPERPPTF